MKGGGQGGMDVIANWPFFEVEWIYLQQPLDGDSAISFSIDHLDSTNSNDA